MKRAEVRKIAVTTDVFILPDRSRQPGLDRAYLEKTAILTQADEVKR
jgi:hypothetical protein